MPVKPDQRDADNKPLKPRTSAAVNGATTTVTHIKGMASNERDPLAVERPAIASFNHAAG